jgi:hypothetical protein
MTPTQANAAYGSNANSAEANAAWNYQNGRDHLIGTLTEAMIAAAPKGTGAGGSDARMDLFKDLMTKLSFATSREEALGVLNTAEDTIRNVFRLPIQLRDEKDYYKLKIPPDAKYIDFITPEGELKRKYRAQAQIP